MGQLSLKFCFLFLAFSMTVSLVGCSSLFYFPSQIEYSSPDKVNLKFEEVWFHSEYGDKIHAWWIPASTPKSLGTIVFFHGNAENMTSHFMNLAWIPEAGYNYFIFDYPGYGKSEGNPTPKTTVLSGNAAVKWVKKNKDQRPLIVYGQSLGGIVALKTVIDSKEEVPYRAVIADSAFSSYQRVAQVKLSNHWSTWLLQHTVYLGVSDRYAPDDHLHKISPIPFLVIHGQKDLTVDPENGEYIYKQAKEPKEIWRIPDGLHNDTFYRHDKVYRQKFLDWLAQH